MFKDAKWNSFHSFLLEMSVHTYSNSQNFGSQNLHIWKQSKYMHPINYISIKLKEKGKEENRIKTTC